MYRPKRAKDVVEAQDKPVKDVPVWVAFLSFVAVCGITFYGVNTMSKKQLRQWNEPFLTGKYISVDRWSFAHMALFAFAGILWPDQPLTLLVFGLLWEGAKYVLVEYDRAFLSVWRSRDVKILWDLWCNIAGYRTGEWVAISIAQWRGSRRRAAERKAARKAAGVKKKE